MFLYQVGLHGNEEVTCCTVSCFHLPHEVLHTKIYRCENMCNEQSLLLMLLWRTNISCCLPLVRSCSLYTWQIAALWFSNRLTRCSVFLNLFCKYSYKKQNSTYDWFVPHVTANPLYYMYKNIFIRYSCQVT